MNRHSPVTGESAANRLPQQAQTERPGQAVAFFLLAKPGIVFAEVLACLAGILLARPATGGTGSGSILVSVALAAGGAAMMNGIIEQTADRVMPRLYRRCRAMETAGTGRVKVIAIALMAAGLALAVKTAPLSAALLLALSCIAYLWLYTAWLKRRSPWGILAGGIPGALPPLIGAATVGDGLLTAPLLLSLFVYVWQLPHFWLLALECRDQYARAGVPVLPLTHGVPLTKRLTMSTALLLLPLSITIGQSASLSPLFTTVTVLTWAGFAFVCACCLYGSHNYRLGFRASLVYLLLFIGAISTDSLAALAASNQW